MVAVEDLWKSYGRQVLFENISFKVNRKERVGVVGRNGHGKTTLFHLIAGLEHPDSGTIAMPKNYRIGYVEQEPRFSQPTILQEAARALPASETDSLWRVEKVLAGLGFGKGDLNRPPAELSGGFQVRLNLAKILLADYDLLLLDEPNNYLDITSIRWLKKFLLTWQGEFMLITHDRSFMDAVVTHVLGIHRKKARKITGNTGKYYAQIAQDEETYEKTRINDERKRKEIELFISRFRAKARLANLVQSRIKTLARMEKREKLEKISTLDFAFTPKVFHGKYAMNVHDLYFAYDPEKPLIRNFKISIGAKDRVFVIGKNGKGKTTLLKLLAGILRPDEGEISTPQAAAIGYFEQTNVGSLQDSNTVLEEIACVSPEADPKRARYISGTMMFEGEDALKRVSILSGGEKSRVMIGKLIATPLNLLLLDEPTNHLDMESADALLAAIDNFDGAVVMVTHNEMFLNALAERLIVFQKDEVSIYEGDYQRFLEKIGWQEEEDSLREKPKRVEAEQDKVKMSKRDLRRLRSEIITERSRLLKPLEKKMAEIERLIEEKGIELSRINQALIEASEFQKGTKIVELSKAMHQLNKEIDSFFSELEALSLEYERKKSAFDKKLEALAEEE